MISEHETPSSHSRAALPVGGCATAEATDVHTRILRLALAVEESRRYWEHVDPAIPPSARATQAFEQRWFGGKSLERVRYLIANFQIRYDVYPQALAVLTRWRSMDAASRQLICHWHLQLSDPIYRRFSDELLNQRRAFPGAKVDRAAVLRWLKAEYPGKWGEATYVQFASKLLSAALEAGLVTRRDPRGLTAPKVTELALGYLMYLLRQLRFEGSLSSNPYLRSVGIDADLLAVRARAVPGLTVHRMLNLVDFDWAYADLASWAREVLP